MENCGGKENCYREDPVAVALREHLSKIGGGKEVCGSCEIYKNEIERLRDKVSYLEKDFRDQHLEYIQLQIKCRNLEEENRLTNETLNGMCEVDFLENSKYIKKEIEEVKNTVPPSSPKVSKTMSQETVPKTEIGKKNIQKTNPKIIKKGSQGKDKVWK